MAQTVGASLVMDRSGEAVALGNALDAYLRKIHTISAHAKTQYAAQPSARVFTQAGVPTTNTSAESPGCDICLIYDTTNDDLYLVYGWSAAGTFTALKILD